MRGGSEEIVDYPEKEHFRSLAELENTIQQLSDKGVYLFKTSGILVGALKPVHLSDEAQKNVMIALLCPDNPIEIIVSTVLLFLQWEKYMRVVLTRMGPHTVQPVSLLHFCLLL